MATRITCPGCGRLLSLPDDCTAKLLSCPRCLAQLQNPQAADRSTAVQAEAPQPPAPVTPSPLPLPRSAHHLPEVDVEVARDSRGASCITIVLAILGSFGVGYALLGSFALALDRDISAALGLLGVLTVLALISATRVAMEKSSETLGAKIGRTMLGVLTLSGAIVGIGALLVFSAVILLFVVCLANGGKC